MPLQNFKKLYQPVKQRICLFPKLQPHFPGNIKHTAFAVNQQPDKAAILIQIDVKISVRSNCKNQYL